MILFIFNCRNKQKFIFHKNSYRNDENIENVRTFVFKLQVVSRDTRKNPDRWAIKKKLNGVNHTERIGRSNRSLHEFTWKVFQCIILCEDGLRAGLSDLSLRTSGVTEVSFDVPQSFTRRALHNTGFKVTELAALYKRVVS